MRVLETCRPLKIKPSGSGDENARILDNQKNKCACLRSYMRKIIHLQLSLVFKFSFQSWIVTCTHSIICFVPDWCEALWGAKVFDVLL